jgi:hypothetical protein
MERAMKTELTGPMDDEMIAEVGYASKRFRGRQVRITIEEVIEEPQTGKRKVKPPNTHQSKNAPMSEVEVETNGDM